MSKPQLSERQLSERQFTDSAQRVVSHVADRAGDRGMYSGELTEATAEMLALLSMLRWERKVGRAALESVVSDCDALARELDNAIDEEGRQTRRPDDPQMEKLASGQEVLVFDRQTPMQRLLINAEQEGRALTLGDNYYVGTEHLLLAIIRCACPLLHELLQRHGVSYDNVKRAIIELLSDR